MENDVSIHIDKEDVAAIAVAEAEMTMRQTIKDLKSQISLTEIRIAEYHNQFKDHGESLIKTRTAEKMKTVSAGLKATKVKDLKAELNTTVVEREYRPNTYNLVIVFSLEKNKMNRGNSGITIESGDFPMTQSQKTLINKISAAEKDKAELIDSAIDWRRKLGDIGMLERQVRARLAKNELEKTPGGKKMIALLVSQFTETVKLLGE